MSAEMPPTGVHVTVIVVSGLRLEMLANNIVLTGSKTDVFPSGKANGAI
jgi:hypothetical protein